MERRILLIETGGTIGAKGYDDPRQPPEITSALPQEQSPVLEVVAKLANGAAVDSFVWGLKPLMKDSKEFTQEDLMNLAQIIEGDSHKHIIITHGTDKMAENAEGLKEVLLATEKVVVFVGAMVPLSMHKKHGGDAVANLDYALQQVYSKPEGVYLVGVDPETKRLGLYEPAQVKKDFAASRSELAFTVRQR